MFSSSIKKGLIIYRGIYSERDHREKSIKYGRHLDTIEYQQYSALDKKLSKRRVDLQGRKKVALKSLHWSFQNMQSVSGMWKFAMLFMVPYDWDIYNADFSLDSQRTALSEDQDDSENELDREIQSGSREKFRNLKRFFKQVNRVSDLSLFFNKMNQDHEKALHYLPMVTMLEKCLIKIEVQSPTDLFALRDILKEAKKRNYWPNIKSMEIKLRHSYNRENCSSRFIRFCQILQEIAEIAKELPWMIKIQLKVKYMWRLDESAILCLQETLEKAQNKLIKLSFVTGQGKQLKPLFNTIEEMKNLEKFSVRCNEPSDVESVNSLEELTKSLKKIQSLRRLKIQGRKILSGEFQTEGFIKDLGDFPQITSLNFQERHQPIDETLWKCFSNSISKLPQLQILNLKTKADR